MVNKHLFICVMVACLAILTAGCVASPKRDFLDQDLLLDPSVVPEVWVNVDWKNVPFDDENGQVSGAFAHIPHLILAKFENIR